MRERGYSVVLAVLAASLSGSGGKPASAAKLATDAAAAPSLAWRDLASPTPLTAAEEATSAVSILARRFNPAMAFGHRDIWPVSLRYAWADGSNLTATVVDD